MQQAHVPRSTQTSPQPFFRLVMCMLAVLFVLIGLGIGAVGATLGLTAEEVRVVASVFLLVGSIDTLVVRFWDRLFRSSN